MYTAYLCACVLLLRFSHCCIDLFSCRPVQAIFR